MGNENLIASVRRHPVLWNIEHKLYRDREVREKNWQNVAYETNGNEARLRQQWRGLRDSFARELRKSIQRGDDPPRSKWKNFYCMAFLIGHIHPNKKKGATRPETAIKKSKMQRVHSEENSIFLLENEKPVSLKTEEPVDPELHDDYYFALSILPYMRGVPSVRKLHLRTKIQQLILEEQQRFAFSSSPISSCSSIESSDPISGQDSS